MANPQQPKFKSFNRKLWLNSGREQLPEGSLRRCVGAAPEPADSVTSRYGSSQLYNLPQVLSLTKYNGVRYQHDGTTLYKNGVSFDNSGYNGGRTTFVQAPPAAGVPNYLFETGGGKLAKISPAGVLTAWGIQPP